MFSRYLTKTVEPKDRPMNINVSEKISKEIFRGKGPENNGVYFEKGIGYMVCSRRESRCLIRNIYLR